MNSQHTLWQYATLPYELKNRTSTNFMTGTGLKKCSPPNLSFLSVTLAISVMDREEVLEAKIVDLVYYYVWKIIRLLIAKLYTLQFIGTLVP